MRKLIEYIILKSLLVSTIFALLYFIWGNMADHSYGWVIFDLLALKLNIDNTLNGSLERWFHGEILN
jgi:hypothetical protein